MKSYFTGFFLWDILCLNPENLLDKATTKNDKEDKEKTLKIYSPRKTVTNEQKNSSKWELCKNSLDQFF